MSTIQQFNYSVDLLQALLWQYNEAERLQKIIELKQQWYNENQSAFWQSWFDDVFNLDTANDFGLTVWSIILGLTLNTVVTGQDPNLPTFGFADATLPPANGHKNFTNGNFRRGAGGSISLDSEQKRIVLKLRYFQLTTKGAVPEVNKFLQRVFAAEGGAYVLDGLDMTLEYVFNFVPSSQLQFVLQKYDVLPRPAGVGVNYTTGYHPTFGFEEDHENFDNGNFIA